MRGVLLVFLLSISHLLIGQTNVESVKWPREISTGKHIITLYQPQLESLKDDLLSGRMAISVGKENKDDLIFGALWFEMRLFTDMDTRIAVCDEIKISKVVFPDIEDDKNIEKLKSVVQTYIENSNIQLSIDNIIADIETESAASALESVINNEAPEVFVRTEETVLVIIDGEPKFKTIENSSIEYVVNTPFFIVRKNGINYLKGGEYWYSSKTIVGSTWVLTPTVPNDIVEIAKQNVDQEKQEAESLKDDGPAKIIVSVKPAELILISGKADLKDIKGVDLAYVSNSESDIIFDKSSKQYFILLNGRWYKSNNLSDGNWDFVEPKDLPSSFASIPSGEEDAISSVKVSVPGTEEAKNAEYEQYIPQTAVVDRKTATVEVKYDGDPKFEKIEGTAMSYAVNTEKTVLFAEGKFFCVDDGIWFESTDAKGPWKVADSRPSEVEKIPPSVPVYNIKYVYIYDSTPTVVYVGYTPGYYHSYYYRGVVVYGTGYYYRPWYGYYYYPRPVTYGFGVHYNPYTGWGFHVGISYGWFNMSFHNHYHHYWGPAGYRHGYRHGYHNGYHHGYHNGYRAGYARGRYDANNLYKNRRAGIQRTGNVNRAQVTNRTRTQTRPSSRPNNVYADKNGNIHVRDKNGNWSQKNNKSKNRSNNRGTTTRTPNKQTRPSTQKPRTSTPRTTTPRTSTPRTSTPRTTNPSRAQLEKQYQNRNRGNSNYNKYKNRTPQTRSAPRSTPRQMPRSSGGVRRRG
ncbi:MAG: hypothetical protein BM564_08900 [Bacteroidetes bacterium MedPE-SWsnd-G2]|nr:MAG: hypothetical protein BM564_08900 [Bacteroidetes bacterium MedPE-SWsnd-G2]